MRNPYPRIASARNSPPGMARVPVQYKLKHPFRYPVDNQLDFEHWYMSTFAPPEARDRLYLPVMWTAYHCANGFGRKPGPLHTLQQFIDTLPQTAKYYTVCQFDDGPLVDFKDLDIIVFGMAGGRVDYQIPLLCQPHAHVRPPARDLTASFIGGMTHECRKQVMALSGRQGYYVTDKNHNIVQYTTIMQRSVFALCPRGYSPTSFRIMEAIHAGCVPVYLSDTHLLPYGLPFDYGILLSPGDDIAAALADIDVNAVRERMDKVRGLYSYAGCKAWILEELKNM